VEGQSGERAVGTVPGRAVPEGAFVHPLAIVDGEIGAGTRVWAWAHVMAGARVGRDCNVGEHCFVEGGASVGDRVTVKNGVAVWQGVELLDDVFVGPSAVFTNDIRPRSRVYHDAYARTQVREGASIGAGAVIVAGHTLGRHCLVGAGSVVTHDVPDHALVYGNPARVRGFVCCCGERLELRAGRATCACGRGFTRLEDGRVVEAGDGEPTTHRAAIEPDRA